jgi:malate dehydrogenase (oxaloacetate-decarboxylating)
MFNVASLDDIATPLHAGRGAYSVQEIIARPDALHELSTKDNMIAVVTDGTAVLGLGRAGARATVPVMEGKAAMFKLLAGIERSSISITSAFSASSSRGIIWYGHSIIPPCSRIRKVCQSGR